ncbi:MAG: diguanylate cyclase [Marinobacter sp.]|uniref:sensor domain-containing diguanylate cyclase n=1 Tax=Marinobacter sp. TaxID=50741 RepID=UPI00299EF9F4|nr:diguanylate cyclase [Marinobacter sp.]MDX1634336.1 diguanylate cyclase [Marinobacter sp.]
MSRTDARQQALRRSLVVVIAYLVIGGGWIAVSDALLLTLAEDPVAVSRGQTLKGWGFVLVTGLVLFVTLFQQFRAEARQQEQKDRQRAEIRDLSQFRQSVIDNANVWINVLDPQGRVVTWNKAAERISGYSRDQVVGSDRIWQWLYPDPDYRAEVWATASEVLSHGREVEGFETRITTRSGSERLMEWSSRRFFDDRGNLMGSIAIGSDVTDRRLAEKILAQRERQLTTLMDNLPGMAYRCLYDEFWTMKFVSSGCRELTGYRPEELVDNNAVAFVELIDQDYDEAILQAVEEAIAAAEPFSVEYQITRKDGEKIWVWERGRGVEDGASLMLEGIILETTDRKRMEQELSRLATHDTLTGLYNRREISRILDEEIQRAERYDRSLAVLWIDLDHFKRVNDQYGHAAGDRVLQALCERLRDNIRAVDAIGRYGGEEFMVLLPEMEEEEARETAERLRALVADKPLALDREQTLALTISIGVAVYPEHGRSRDELCDAADRAMYQAKSAGRNQVCLARGQSAGESW